MDWKVEIDKLGISICPNSSVAVAGAMKLRNNEIIKKDDEVVVILTAHGSKFSDTSAEYHNDNTNKFANQTHTINPDINLIENILGL